MKASIAACSASWLRAANAEADADNEVDAGWEPTITGTREDAIEAGTPPEVNAAEIEDVSSGGLSRLEVGGGVVVATASEFD